MRDSHTKTNTENALTQDRRAAACSEFAMQIVGDEAEAEVVEVVQKVETDFLVGAGLVLAVMRVAHPELAQRVALWPHGRRGG